MKDILSYINYFKIVIKKWLYFLMVIVDLRLGYSLLLFVAKDSPTKRYYQNYQMNFVIKQILKNMADKMPNKAN